jgi:nicotinamide riboside kinase
VASGQGRWSQEDRQEQKNVRKIWNNDIGYFQWSGETWMADRPYYYEERVFYSTLSSAYLTAANRATGDAATTLCPLDYAAAATAKLVAEYYALRYPHELEFWQTVLIVAQERFDKYERKYGPEAKVTATRERDLPRFYVRV